MPSRANLFRFAALLMLLLTGVELVTCEVLSPASCEMAGTAGQSSDCGDACICCCCHVVVSVPVTLQPAEVAAVLEPPKHVEPAGADPLGIRHPPKA